MALNHLKICSKCNTFVWGNIADRSRIIKSVSFTDNPTTKEEAVISRFFMKPFTSKLTERSKTRHCSIAVKSILRALNFWLQLGVQRLTFKISDRFKNKLIYELYDYCDSPDSKPVNVLALDSLISLISRQPNFQFSQVMFALHNYVARLALPARALALAQQIVTSISLIIDSISYFITFMSVFHQSEEEVGTFIRVTASNPSSLRDFFESGFKNQLPSSLSIGVSNQGVTISRVNQSLLTPHSRDMDIDTLTNIPNLGGEVSSTTITKPNTSTLNLIQPDRDEIYYPTPTQPHDP